MCQMKLFYLHRFRCWKGNRWYRVEDTENRLLSV